MTSPGALVPSGRVLSAGEMATLVAAGDVSPTELVEASLARISEVNPSLNCFCAVRDADAVAEAAAATAAVARREALGPLHGVPIALKDTTPVAGQRTTLGSYTHEHWVPSRDAYVAARLRAAGAIVVGTTTTPEFAHAGVTDSPLWGTTRNPWNPQRSPGGSSGGSGAAVASGCVPLAEGSDMGGSVRIPAAWCGVVGLKPSFGRIPMDVLPGLFDSLSHHGPLARTVDDARLFTSVLQGSNDADVMSMPRLDALDSPLGADVRGLRVGVSVDLGAWAVHPEIEAAVRHTADVLHDAGAVVEHVTLHGSGRLEELWDELWAVFMAAYYGHFLEEFRDRMTPGVVRLIERGNVMDAVHYKRLEIERTNWWRDVAAVFADHDAILCPTMATSPSPAAMADLVRERPPDDGRYHGDDMTAVWNLVAPCPAISVPAGFHHVMPDAGLPIGVQFVGRRWRDDIVLRLAAAVEAAGPQSA
jgi:Asp-tRNA(Asn)/Glu-tRNA(Gln) amidotransferase A subunit family amidase